ncbi:hypothetical protein F5884DRAFT_776476 [Xylogone sp. PMI_703]|nr:hypothetical protein F5884DRAFT_776476 [Xylogone sp. PMI_703]
MSNELTLRPAGSLESIASSRASEDFAFDDFSKTSPEKNDFLTDVRGKIKKWGSVAGSSRPFASKQAGGPAGTEFAAAISQPIAPPATAVVSVSASTPTPTPAPAATAVQPTTTATTTARKHEKSPSVINTEKPLPKTPISSPGIDPPPRPFSPPETPRPALTTTTTTTTSTTMSRPAISGSRSSTMDSATTNPVAGGYNNGYRTGPYATDMTSSMSSLDSAGVQERDEEPRENITLRSNGPASAGPSPAQTRPSGGAGSATPAGAGSSTHLSGLMCNVHRTTGREPHPLVGATTTILGDKLYVFGGRILSRTRPALTSDLYELDLIRRHWTKLETMGDIPPPRYFHSMCALGDTKLVCYGGMSPAPVQSPGAAAAAAAQNGPDAQPEVVVMSDIYIYDAPTRTWTFIPTQEMPQGRYAHCATILPSSATFSSVNAPTSALHHNPPSSVPNQGTIGVNIDGTGGAEMVVVGGQDSQNHYIEQISVFNLRSLKWTSTQPLGKSCGAYRSVVAPLSSSVAARIGKGDRSRSDGSGGISQEAREAGSSMLIYSNYNFLDVKLELQVRSSDGTLSEKPMLGNYSPPGLRFPNGGVIDTNFVVSGTYLTSSKQEYALWALDLRTLTWSRIDAGGSVFSQGSWNRGILWNRRNTFVILGSRKRSLVEDYNHRRINFSNVCMVELEAFGLYDNPRKVSAMSGYVSASSPYNAPSLSIATKAGWTAGGRVLSKAAEDLGQMALSMKELADMEILCVDEERIPVNSRIIARRWGPYFIQLLREGAATQDGADTATVRQDNVFRHNPSRNSSVTITPSADTQSGSTLSLSSTLNNSTAPSIISSQTAASNLPESSLFQPPDANSLAPSSRPRTLFLPHTRLTVESLLHYLYTSSLPPTNTPLCTPQILCSLLQIARPYRIDGLLEAVVERLHSILDSRNAAAVFNASAMAAGGGRATSAAVSPLGETWLSNMDVASSNGSYSDGRNGADHDRNNSVVSESLTGDMKNLRINTSVGNSFGRHHDEEPASATSSAASDVESDTSGAYSASASGTSASGMNSRTGSGEVREIWKGDISAVIGLQKRGLRGLMEGRRLRERGGSVGPGVQQQQSQQGRIGLGIANG